MPHHQPDSSRCTFSYRDGRRCRMLIMPGADELCPYHHRQRLNGEGTPVTERLVHRAALDNLWAIRRALKHTLRDVALGRLTPHAGEVLIKLGRMLLKHTRRSGKRLKPRAKAA